MHKLTYTLVFVGALNWGLYGLFGLDLVELLFGFSPVLVQIVYVAVGVSAILDFKGHMSYCKECSVEMKAASTKKKKK